MQLTLFSLAFALSAIVSAQEAPSPRLCYSGKDQLFGVSFGATKSDVFAALGRVGIATGDHADVTCTRSTKDGSEEFCDVNVESAAWRNIRPYPVIGDEHFSFVFKDGLLVGSVQLLEFVDRGDAVQTYYKSKEAFAVVYRKPGKNPGFWRRQVAKFGSSLLGTKFVNAANWEDEQNASAVVFLLGHPNTFLMVVHGRKGFDE